MASEFPCTCFHVSIHHNGCGKKKCDCRFTGDPGNPMSGINCVIVLAPKVKA